MLHWEECVTTTFLAMASKSPSRAEILAHVTAVLTGQTPLDPGASPDLLPIAQATAPPAPTPTPAKKADRPGYSSVSVVRRTRSTEPEMDDRGLTSGGRPPEEFWNEPDPYPKARRAKMTKRLPMGRRV